MFGLFKQRLSGIGPTTVTAPELHERLRTGSITLIDVREPPEFRAERIPGAINIPLSRFEAGAAGIPRDKPVILHCLSGSRSKSALGVCGRLGLPIDTHLGGGISAWKAAGFPVER